MNNINTVENARAIMADTNVKNAGGSDGAAKSEVEGGKTLPPSVQSEAPKQPEKAVEVTSQRTARVEKAVEQLNDYVQSLQRDLRFTMDEDLGRAVVRVVDRNTQEVIRQIPNETALRLARNLKEVELQRLQAPSVGVEGSLGLINTRI
jgi:flagellar protein FlaG